MRVDVEKSISGCQYNIFVEEVGTKLVYLILKRKFESFLMDRLPMKRRSRHATKRHRVVPIPVGVQQRVVGRFWEGDRGICTQDPADVREIPVEDLSG